MRTWRTLPILACGLAPACANQAAPPGTRPDSDPPRIVEQFPEEGAVVPDLDRDIKIRFDEPLADPRGVERFLIISPADRYRVRPGRREIRIRPEPGWRPGVVYYVRLLPGITDLLRNRTTRETRWLFSTGPEVPTTRVEGHVYDRLRMQGVRDARLLFLGPDSVPYTAVSDTGGVFSMPALPPAGYRVLAFVDQNRDLSLQREFEPYDSARVALTDPAQRARLEMWLVAPDTTPPVLIGAAAVDSLRVRLEFDEALEPEHPLDEAGVVVRSEESGTRWPVTGFRVETAAAGAEQGLGPGKAEAAPVAEERPAVGVEARPRPSPFVDVELGRSLEEGTYRVRAEGFANLRLLIGGGDTTFVYELPPDSLRLPSPDSVEAVSGDSLRPEEPDSLRKPAGEGGEGEGAQGEAP